MEKYVLVRINGNILKRNYCAKCCFKKGAVAPRCCFISEIHCSFQIAEWEESCNTGSISHMQAHASVKKKPKTHNKKSTNTSKQWITLKSVIIFAIAIWIFYFSLLCCCPLSLLAWKREALEKAELRQIKGSVCWDKRWYHVETNYRGAVSKCVEAITAIQQPYQQGCSVPLAYARCM